MGAVLEMALGIDILKVEGKKQGRQPQISSFDLVPAAGVSDHLAQATRGSKRSAYHGESMCVPSYGLVGRRHQDKNIGGPRSTVTVLLR